MSGSRGLGLAVQRLARWARACRCLRLSHALHGGALLLDPSLSLSRREYHRLRAASDGGLRRLRFVALGTTGLCNASCIHCPTGKAATAHAPRAAMPMALFDKIIDGIVQGGFEVDALSFGLFGDGLVDPHVVARAARAREALPDVMIDINTNGAAFNPERHGALRRHVSLVTLHCESIRAPTYDRLMQPLRLHNVQPKHLALLAAFSGKVRVSVPVSRANLAELDETRAWFMEHGALEVVFDPLSSRCADDRALFQELALAPVPIRCAPDIMTDLIVDCDGLVLACCQDFARREPIGDLARDSFPAVLDALERRRFGDMLASGDHARLETCSRCFGDGRSPDFPFDWAPAEVRSESLA